MKRYSTGNRIAMNTLRRGDFGDVLGITGAYMTAPTYFEGAPDYTGFYLHHCVHYMDLIPWFAGDDFGDMQVRSVSPAPGKLLLHMQLHHAGRRDRQRGHGHCAVARYADGRAPHHGRPRAPSRRQHHRRSYLPRSAVQG